MTNLHPLKYFGFKKTLTATAGLAPLLLVFTGFVMWARACVWRAQQTRMESIRGP